MRIKTKSEARRVKVERVATEKESAKNRDKEEQLPADLLWKERKKQQVKRALRYNIHTLRYFYLFNNKMKHLFFE